MGSALANAIINIGSPSKLLSALVKARGTNSQ